MLAAVFHNVGIGLLGVALAFGLWLFWVAPIVGAALAGMVYRSIFEER